jgi:anti-sigma factor RsiW
VQQRPAAALVYRRREHVINLFVVPAGPEAEPLAEHTHHGYHIVQWRHGDLAYWAISDLNVSELDAFARLAGASPEVTGR